MPSLPRECQSLENAGVAAVVIDAADRIILWNPYAERLFGLSAEDVLGQPCYDVLAGRDLFGNRYCSTACPLSVMHQSGEAIHPVDMSFRCGGADRQLTMLSLTVPVSDGRSLLVHLFMPAPNVASLRRPEPEVPPRLPISAEPSRRPPETSLTRRELEVLRLLADGRSTVEIAAAMRISRATVRNHVQHILDKLGVQGRLEAILHATRLKIL